MSTPDQLQLFALPDLPMVQPGDDLAALIIAALDRAGRALTDRDVVVVAQKIVSKSENRVNGPSKCNSTVPMGPWRCLATTTSATLRISSPRAIHRSCRELNFSSPSSWRRVGSLRA